LKVRRPGYAIEGEPLRSPSELQDSRVIEPAWLGTAIQRGVAAIRKLGEQKNVD
jgi:hypothetical protein